MNEQIKIGSIFAMSWGYDQTNVNFFQVTRMSGKGVFVREIGQKGVENTQGFMCQRVIPIPDQFLDNSQWTAKQSFQGNPELFRRLQPDSKAFSIKGRYFASLWDNKPCYSSWYA
jgi:hypothetical protein